MKSEIDEATINSSNAISFSTSTDKLTKASVLDNDFEDGDDFGLYAYHTVQSTWAEYTASSTFAAPNFMNNQTVTYEDEAWTYSPTKYWPNTSGDMISFFAYMPKNEAGDSDIAKTSAAYGEDAFPIVTFTQVMDAEKMTDFVVAKTLDQTKTTSPVTLSFEHVLTRLNFSAQTTIEDANTKAFVKSIEVVGGSSAKLWQTASYNINDSAWTTYALYMANLAVTPILNTEEVTFGDYTNDAAVAVTANTTATSLLKTNEYLFLIPPSTAGVESTSDIQFNVEYDLVTKDDQLDSDQVSENSVTFSMPNGTLLSGVAYNVVLTFDMEGIVVAANIVQWESEESYNTALTEFTVNSVSSLENAMTQAFAAGVEEATIEYKGEVEENIAITIPTTETTTNLYLDFTGHTGTIAITTNSNYAGELTIDAPNATVTIDGGTYENLTVWTAASTLIISEDTTVNGLTINAGNVAVYGTLDGDISLGDSNSAATITFMSGSTNAIDSKVDDITVNDVPTDEGIYYSLDSGAWTTFSPNSSSFSLPDGDYTEVKVITVGDATIANSASAKLFAKSGLTKIDLGDAKFDSEAWSAYSTGSQTTLQTLILPKEGITSYTSHFQGYTALTHIELPEGPTSLVTKMFWKCSSLEEITLPQSVVTFEGEWTFRGCSKLKKINVGNITTWSTLALRECGFEDQSEIVLNESVTELPSSFLAYNPIKSFVVPEHITIIGAMAFGGCTEMTSITLHDGITSIGSSAFTGCTSIGDIDIPENDEFTILNTSFCYNWAALKTVTIPDNVTELGYLAFAYSGLEGAFTIPSQIKFSDPGYNRQFQSCSGLTSITIEASGNEITLPLRIFNGCAALESLDIPSNVIATADYLLYANKMMNTIICRATTPPTTMSNDFGGIISTGFNGYVCALVTGDKILYVPTESVEAYKAKATDGTDNIVESTDADGNITTNENYWKTVLIDVCGFEVKPITD